MERVGRHSKGDCRAHLLLLCGGRQGACTLPFELWAGENISARFVVPTVAASVDLVLHLGIDEHGVRRVNEVVGVPGRVENDVIEIEPIFVRHGTELRRTGGLPPRLEEFERRGIDLHRILSGRLAS